MGGCWLPLPMSVAYNWYRLSPMIQNPQQQLSEQGDALKRIEQLYRWEKAVNELTWKIRSHQGKEDIIRALVNEVGTALASDRCFLFQLDEHGHPQPISHEYRRTSEIASFKGFVPPWESCPYLLACRK